MDLVEHFNEHLEAVVADTDELNQEAYRVRYDSYCLEKAYVAPEQFEDQLEKDEYDVRSVQAIVRHRKTGSVTGVVRLILPEESNPCAHFPIEQHYQETFYSDVLDHFRVQRTKIAEISRFTVSKKRKLNLKKGAFAGLSYPQKYEETVIDPLHSLLPHIILGLFAMVFSISKQYGITHLYAAMDPSLARLLTRYGIRFTKIGPTADYHGIRQPMIAQLDDLERGVCHARPDCWSLALKLNDIGGMPVNTTILPNANSVVA